MLQRLVVVIKLIKCSAFTRKHKSCSMKFNWFSSSHFSFHDFFSRWAWNLFVKETNWCLGHFLHHRIPFKNNFFFTSIHSKNFFSYFYFSKNIHRSFSILFKDSFIHFTQRKIFPLIIYSIASEVWFTSKSICHRRESGIQFNSHAMEFLWRRWKVWETLKLRLREHRSENRSCWFKSRFATGAMEEKYCFLRILLFIGSPSSIVPVFSSCFDECFWNLLWNVWKQNKFHKLLHDLYGKLLRKTAKPST